MGREQRGVAEQLKARPTAAGFQVVTDKRQLLGHGLARPRRAMGKVLQLVVLHGFASRFFAIE